MIKPKATSDCKGCAKLRSIISWMIERIREVDATSGEACYDMCQEVQRRIGNVKARNGTGKRRSVGSKSANRKSRS